MNFFLKVSFYVFHPIWIPIFGTLLYFKITPKDFSSVFIQYKLASILILSALIPMVLLYALKEANKERSIDLQKTNSQRVFLVAISLLLITLNNFIIGHQIPELFYFFTGLLLSYSFVLLLTYFKLKVSIHIAALCSLLSFIMALSYVYRLNLLLLIVLLILAIALTATARLANNAHSPLEVNLAILTGFVPQLMLLLALHFYKI